MNRDDIIRMARQAGVKACCGRTDKSGKHHPTVNALFSTVPVQWLEQFANLVASEEREACAQVCDLEAAKWLYPSHGNAAVTMAATAIRARKETK